MSNIPEPGKNEQKQDFISRCIPIVRDEGKPQDQAVAICNSIWRQKGKKEHLQIHGLKVKEEEDSMIVEGLVATTHPDRVGDILSHEAVEQIADFINKTEVAGGQEGAYRSVSLHHDWINEGDPTLDEAAFLKPNAEVVELEDGHKGVKVTAEINKFYKGDMTPEEIKYRIDNGQIAGFSIEYDTDNGHCKQVEHQGESFRFIEELTEFGGVGFARARMIANPHAVMYKEIRDQAHSVNEKKIKEADTMAEEETKPSLEEEEKKEEAPVEEEKEEAKPEEEPKKEEEEKPLEEKEGLTVKDVLDSKEFKEAVETRLQVKSKVIKQDKEVTKMESKEVLCVKEMQEKIATYPKHEIDMGRSMQYKQAALKYLNTTNFEQLATSTGAPLNPTMETSCVNLNTKEGAIGMGKLVVTSGLQMKAAAPLDTTTNASTYTQNIVEFSDVYTPMLVDTFNNQTNLWGALPKRDHLLGGNKYGWRITTDQELDNSVDPDDPTVIKTAAGKLKLQTDIKEYRRGISVTDYTLWHSRGSLANLFMIEAEKRMRDIMRGLNNDLFTEQVDDGTKIIGLEAVADSAGNTTIFGLTRSAANRLAPTSAADTYSTVGAGISAAAIREAARKVEVEGAMRENLRIIVNPTQRDAIYNLEDTNIRYRNDPTLGFFGAPSYDGIPMIVDSSCQTDALFVVDFESYYAVISRGPQMIGLAKVGAAEEAYINMFIAIVYEQPRRIYMLDTLA